MVAVTQAIEHEPLFEFNPAAPEFSPSQYPVDGDSTGSMLGSSERLAKRVGCKSNRPPLPQDRGGEKESASGQEPEPESRALSCSPQLLPRRSGRPSQRRQPGSGRRPCATAPASPALSMGGKLGPCRRGSEEVSTLVIKNLALDFRKEDVEVFLESMCVGAAEVDMHVDPASGSFRGTAFVRYASPAKAREALQKLGPSPDIGGRKARVEVQKSKNLFGRRNAVGELPQELTLVQKEIELFLQGFETEVCLSATFDAHQRKYAHSLAERHNLVHATRQNESGQTYVYLSKCRPSQANAGNRKKAFSMDARGTPQLGAAAGGTLCDMGYEAHSQSCYVGPMSPPGLLFQGLELGTPVLGPELAGSEDAMFMLPSAAVPLLPPGIDPAIGLPGVTLPPAWPAAGMVLGTEPPPGLGLELQGLAELAEGLCRDLVDPEELHLDFKHACPPSDSAMSTEDRSSQRSDDTDHC
mmetsp:Transcript_59064/g.138194  ORF Transcript_59064/g.138194 Transcript_59064/m.138194 type:complete len:469 (-) Transcript_59064:70-1476(-)